MQILTINLDKNLEQELSSQLSDKVQHSKSMDDACSIIESNDIHCIIKNTSAEACENDAINSLLGLTPISTKLILIGDTIDGPLQAQWRELGIDFLLSPSSAEIIQKISTNSP